MPELSIAELHRQRYTLRRKAILHPPSDPEAHQRQLADLDARIIAAHAERATRALAN